MLIPAHLGGYIEGGDEATYFPDLWTWMVEKLDVSSVLDIGCGEGHSTRFFRDLGCDVLGIDGVPQDDPDISTHDFTHGPLEPRVTFDLGWCCEFLEHIEERFLPNLVQTFQACEVLAVTHAFPGQGGHHHVNCRDAEYWKGYFAAIGLHFDAGLTQRARAVASFNEHPNNHFLRSGLILTRSG